MVEDRSLDEFAGSDAGGVPAGENGADAPESDADPAVSTSAWIDAGTDCERCGEPITRGWFDDGALCCADCTEW